MRLARTAALVSVAGLTLVGLGATAASADPNGAVITVTCGNQSISVNTQHADVHWTPGLVADATAVLHPVAFQNETIVVRDAQGNVVFSNTDETFYRHSSQKTVDSSVKCSYHGVFAEGGETATVSGDVWVRAKDLAA